MLLNAYEITDYDDLDFNTSHFKRGCNHDFNEDLDEEFEKKLFTWVIQFQKQLIHKRKHCPEVDRTHIADGRDEDGTEEYADIEQNLAIQNQKTKEIA